MKWAGSTAHSLLSSFSMTSVWDIPLIVREGHTVLVAASFSSPRPLCQTINVQQSLILRSAKQKDVLTDEPCVGKCGTQNFLLLSIFYFFQTVPYIDEINRASSKLGEPDLLVRWEVDIDDPDKLRTSSARTGFICCFSVRRRKPHQRWQHKYLCLPISPSGRRAQSPLRTIDPKSTP